MKSLPTLLAFCLSLLALPFLALFSSPSTQQSSELAPSSTLPDSTSLPSIDDWAITTYPHHESKKIYAVYGKLSVTYDIESTYVLRDDYDNLIATFPICGHYGWVDLDDEWLVYDMALQSYYDCLARTPTPAPALSPTGQTQTPRRDRCEIERGCGIVAINLKTGEQRPVVANGGAINVAPSVSRNHVIWGEYGDITTNLFLQDLVSGQTTQLTHNSDYDSSSWSWTIQDDWVFWEQTNPYNSYLNLLNLVTSETISVPISSGALGFNDPVLFGSQVAFSEYSGPNGQQYSDIFLYDLVTKVKTPIILGGEVVPSGEELKIKREELSFDGQHIAWREYVRDPNPYPFYGTDTVRRVMVYDLNSRTTVMLYEGKTLESSVSSGPFIGDGFITWGTDQGRYVAHWLPNHVYLPFISVSR